MKRHYKLLVYIIATVAPLCASAAQEQLAEIDAAYEAEMGEAAQFTEIVLDIN